MKRRLAQTPLAISSSGEIIINAAYAIDDDLEKILTRLGPHAVIFIGVVVPRRTLTKVLKQIDDFAAEIAGTMPLSAIGVSRQKVSDQAGGPHSLGPSTNRQDDHVRRR